MLNESTNKIRMMNYALRKHYKGWMKLLNMKVLKI